MENRRGAPRDEWFRMLYERHFDFVWRTLRHLGVRDSDLADVCQDVFIVVHRRFPSFEPRAKVTSWMFRICSNMARDRRRRAHVQNELLGDDALEHAVGAGSDPLTQIERKDELRLFELALARMDFDQRAAFILFEIEGMTGPEAAAALEVPLATAYSRLRLARQAFLTEVERAAKVRQRPHARPGGTR